VTRPRALGALVLSSVVAASLGSRSPPRGCWLYFVGASTIVWANTIVIGPRRPPRSLLDRRPVADRHPDGSALCVVSPGRRGADRRRSRRRPAPRFSVKPSGPLGGDLRRPLFGVLLRSRPVRCSARSRPGRADSRSATLSAAGGGGPARLSRFDRGPLSGTMTLGADRDPLLGTPRTFIAFALALCARRGVGDRPAGARLGDGPGARPGDPRPGANQ